MALAIWTCTSFEGHWPVGTAAVVVASDAEEAARLLTEEVKKITPQVVKPSDMVLVDPYKRGAIILNNGDY